MASMISFPAHFAVVCFSLIPCLQTALLSRRAQRADESDLLQSARLASGTSIVGPPSCDVSLSGPLCFAGQRQVLMPNAVQNGLVGHWTFDSDRPVDVSGNGNHGVTELVHGPAPAGGGHSATFTHNFLMVPNSPTLKLDDFTYSFWIYLVDDGVLPPQVTRNSAWCPLIRKGIAEPETWQFDSAPSLLFSHSTGYLRAEVTTTIEGTKDGENVRSNARLLPNRWVHLALVHHSSHGSLLLYVNGILDTALNTQGPMLTNDYPLYIGGDPFTKGDCGFTTYIDEVRVYAHAVPPHLLQAEAAPALGGTDPSFVRLGCLQCSVEEAARSCPATRHICTALELHTGAYQVARSVGWLLSGTHVWTHEAVKRTAAASASKSPAVNAEATTGLGLCCDGAP